MADVTRASAWTEAVFHVLAHVPSSAPASCHSRAYVAWSASLLGPSTDRELGDDVASLARVASTHAALGAVQILAWVFDDAVPATAVSDRELAALGAVDVADPTALRACVRAGASAEILRAAAELELPRLANVAADDGLASADPSLIAALSRVSPAAPALADFRVATVRALGLRGRVFGERILVGAPTMLRDLWQIEAPHAHVAWQAAHEATVAAVARDLRARRRDDDANDWATVERLAIARLSEGAAREGLASEHAQWLARFDCRGLVGLVGLVDP